MHHPFYLDILRFSTFELLKLAVAAYESETITKYRISKETKDFSKDGKIFGATTLREEFWREFNLAVGKIEHSGP